MNDLFNFQDSSAKDDQSKSFDDRPLAERARPQSLDEFVGQLKALGAGQSLRRQLDAGKVPNLILWGPPGCGKTTLASIISKKSKGLFLNRSAIDTGAKELKADGELARHNKETSGQKTILFLDEIHRLNRAQQDCLLPYVERGDLVLIGATTENPSFELNAALLSRCQVVIFEKLKSDELEKLVNRGLKVLEPDLDIQKVMSPQSVSTLIDAAIGDGRRTLNLVENVYSRFVLGGRQFLSDEEAAEAYQKTVMPYDKNKDAHYQTISAFIKSMRGSDPHGALYYLVRMLKGGEDPLFIARRMVIFASEDVGNADPRALQVAMNVKEAVEFVGLPEAAINLAQGVTYLACSPKSNRSYVGLRNAEALVEKTGVLDVPLFLRNAATSFLKKLGYGRDYEYSHDSANSISHLSYLPDEVKDTKLYEPTERGYEKQIKAYLDWVQSTKNEKGTSK